ncbi:unnamed protein product [Adineta ricciae]|uniref:NmrA-like domain-containing protein n=1 Tax=Adineta ricciae TaxID=249248 RepID=A0A815VKG3_ADIRI|nr:unnamed protein product [Adineta ricciae]CAF1662556.1 unnamed protein product [Adineta ricciae]
MSSSKETNIFLNGATGYIGGSILTALLNHSNASNFQITALIRGAESRIKKLELLGGVIALVGSNDSHDLIEKAASQADVVFHTANSSDDLPSTKSILSGLNQRTENKRSTAERLVVRRPPSGRPLTASRPCV